MNAKTMNDISKKTLLYLDNQLQSTRNQIFEMNQGRFDRLEDQIGSLRKEASEAHANLERRIDELEKKIVWIYAFAAGIGLAGSFIIEWIKRKLF